MACGNAVAQYRASLLMHREVTARVKALRAQVALTRAEAEHTESQLECLQAVGMLIAEVLRVLDEDRCVVKSSSGPRYVVGMRAKIKRDRLVPGARVALDLTTLTIMRVLPRELDVVAARALDEQPGGVSYSAVGGLGKELRDLREAIELPLLNPELFARVGVAPPSGVLLYGPPGTGKTLLARALASNLSVSFMKLVASSVVDKYIGESARLIRELFEAARERAPCVVFIDEIDALGGKRFGSGSTSADREVQRTLMELLNQLDGFASDRASVKVVFATNRPDVLDPALLRPGRIDRKIEIPLPNEAARMDILKIHLAKVAKQGDVDVEALVKLTDGFNGADLRNVTTEAGMFAIRDERDFAVPEDFVKACRKIAEGKKVETSTDFAA